MADFVKINLGAGETSGGMISPRGLFHGLGRDPALAVMVPGFAELQLLEDDREFAERLVNNADLASGLPRDLLTDGDHMRTVFGHQDLVVELARRERTDELRAFGDEGCQLTIEK